MKTTPAFAIFATHHGVEHVLLTDGCSNPKDCNCSSTSCGWTSPANCQEPRVSQDIRDFGTPLFRPRLFSSAVAAWDHIGKFCDGRHTRVGMWSNSKDISESTQTEDNECKWIIQRRINAARNKYEDWPHQPLFRRHCEGLLTRAEMLEALRECERRWPAYEFRGHVVGRYCR